VYGNKNIKLIRKEHITKATTNGIHNRFAGHVPPFGAPEAAGVSSPPTDGVIKGLVSSRVGAEHISWGKANTEDDCAMPYWRVDQNGQGTRKNEFQSSSGKIDTGIHSLVGYRLPNFLS
jgi:hypothetical protein